MGKVEIKIRKKILTPDNLQQYRNYPALLKKYKHNKRFKRALRIFLYSLALTIFVLALIFLSMWRVLLDKEQEKINPEKAFIYLNSRPDGKFDTVLFELVSKSRNDSMHLITYKHSRFTSYQFPINSSYNKFTNYKLIASKSFEADGKYYTINKYFRDQPQYTDDQAYYFYSPDFGILQIKSMMWSSKTLASTNQFENDAIIARILKEMTADQEFYSLQ